MIFKLGFVGKHNLDIKQQAERILKSKRSIGNRRLRRKIRILRKHRDLKKYQKDCKKAISRIVRFITYLIFKLLSSLQCNCQEKQDFVYPRNDTFSLVAIEFRDVGLGIYHYVVHGQYQFPSTKVKAQHEFRRNGRGQASLKTR